VPDILGIGTKTWNRLSKKQKNWLTKAVKEATLYQRELWAKAENEALIEIKKAGVTVNIPNKKLFVTRSSNMIKSLETKD
jgi:TRAP-type C4-dicarboxylate transport system substrate-binding protein